MCVGRVHRACGGVSLTGICSDRGGPGEGSGGPVQDRWRRLPFDGTPGWHSGFGWSEPRHHGRQGVLDRPDRIGHGLDGDAAQPARARPRPRRGGLRGRRLRGRRRAPPRPPRRRAGRLHRLGDRQLGHHLRDRVGGGLAGAAAARPATPAPPGAPGRLRRVAVDRGGAAGRLGDGIGYRGHAEDLRGHRCGARAPGGGAPPGGRARCRHGLGRCAGGCVRWAEFRREGHDRGGF